MSVAFTGAQTAGNLNVVAVGWNTASRTINSVVDTKGNVYTLAIGPTKRGTTLTQSIYYAKNIASAAAGANSVTITFSGPAQSPDVRIAEYSGIDPVNPVDVSVGANGSSATASSGSVTTTNATDLLFGASYVATHNTGPGSGFTQRIITDPDGDIVEDQAVTAIGSYAATAPMASGGWVMQLVAFRAATLNPDNMPPTAPTNLTATAISISQINLAWTAATDNVAVTNYLVERCQGAGCSNFAQIGTTTGTTFNNTGLAVATAYSYRVRATDAANNLGPYAAVASTSTLADTTPPSAPSNLAATVASQTQINLAWTASTDNVGVTGYLVERCQGPGCSDFAQIGTATGTTFSNTGLATGTSYSYRVRATDAANNLGAYSNVATALTPAPDVTPPTAPSNLTATAVSATQINLAWTASTDNVGVTNYLIERCTFANCTSFAQIAMTTGTTFNDTGLVANWAYSYRVRATDAASNFSDYSNIASATTFMLDTTPPSAPSNLVATASSSSQIGLTWTASTDDVGVTAYMIERCQGTGCSNFAPIATSTSPSFNDGSLLASTPYSYRVRASDAASNLSGYSNVATATTQAPSGTPLTPAFVQGNSADPQGNFASVTVTFTAAQAAGDLNVVATGWADSTAQVTAVTDSKGNVYTRAVGPTVVTGALTQSIYYAKNIAAAAAGANTVTVTFNTAATFPDIRIVQYHNVDAANPLDVVGTGTGTTGSTSTSTAVTTTNATDLLFATNMLAHSSNGPGSGFTQRFISTDGDIVEDRVVTAIGSYSASAGINSTGAWIMHMVAFRAALSTPDTTPPTAPSNLTATAFSPTQINLAWTAATDNVGVTSYLVESCQGAGCSNFAQIGTSNTTTFSSTGLTAGTGYSYRVRASDAANNLGPYSNVAGATTAAPDSTPPSAPSNLAGTSISSAEIDLTWTAATDDVGVTSYLVERCQGVGCSNFAQIGTATNTNFASAGLVASTSYSFRVRASDAATNLGPYSNVATAVTGSAPVTPAFIQGNFATPQVPQATVQATYNSAQAAGHFNVVIVGWNDNTTIVTSIADTKGNAYTRAVGPNITTSGWGITQSIYYARNIAAAAAGANTVTVSFSSGANFPDIRVLEYSGIDTTTPVDVATAGQGNGNTASTPSMTTTNPVDLLVASETLQTSTSNAGIGAFTARMLTSPDGDGVQDRIVNAIGAYTATADLNSTGNWVIQMVAFRAAGSGSGGPGDTTPPVVSITAPTAGTTQAGIITVSANASDNTGVAGVQLKVDNNPVGQPVTAAPYQFILDTASFSNGAHQIGVQATDFAANVGNASIGVTFNNDLSNTALYGSWTAPTSLPIVPVHTELLPNGKILMSDGQGAGADARVWNPGVGFTTVSAPSNLFCGASEQMADGRIFWIGGHNNGAHLGLTDVNIFDPVAQAWTPVRSMANPRWYPTVTALPDGRMLAMGGESNCNFCYVSVAEIYNPANNTWTSLSSAPKTLPYYPHVFVMSDGRVIVPSAGRAPITSQILNLGTLTWSDVGGTAVEGGSAVMYMPDKFLKTGSTVDPDQALKNSVNTAYVLDMTQPTPTWRQVASMAFSRAFHTLTSLPDGNVLVTGGGPTSAATDTANAILQAEIWSPTSETWSTMAPMHSPRLYHSEAILMPDARILVLGGGRFNDATTVPTDQLNAEFYSPPYLFQGPRPAITSAPTTLQYGQAFTVQTPDAARIAKVSLIRYGTVTHAINMGQRFLPLAFTAGSGSLTVTAPVNNNLAPPGNYLLFIVDNLGVPSVAATVHF